jgi:HSP20 family molecular chaperone IbpA
MYDIFKEFDMLFNRFTRPVMDQSPYKIFRTEDDKIVIAINTLGFGKDDIKIEQEADRLYIKGQKTLDEIDYTSSVDLGFYIGKIVNDIKEINYRVQDGLTYVYIELKEKKKDTIKIKYKD